MATDPRLTTHLPKEWLKDIEEGEILIKSFRMIRGVLKVVVDDESPLWFYGGSTYFYKGVKIEEDTNTPNGYWGRWYFMVGGTKRRHTASMAQCVAEIERQRAELSDAR